MGIQEGLILQGCGGDPQEWLDGINQILTDEGILKKGTRFKEAYTFEHDGLICLLFPFKERMAIEMGRLAMWRLQTHPHFGAPGCLTMSRTGSGAFSKSKNRE